MSAIIIDGKSIAAAIRREIAGEVRRLKTQGPAPGLAVVLVGEDPASQVYVRQKGLACEQAGILSKTWRMPAEVSENELLKLIQELNADRRFHGVLVQLPLPAHIRSQVVIEGIDPRKDVDCFHPYNVGKLMQGEPVFIPATPAGVIELLQRSHISTAGKHVVIVGRSNIVGKPLANLLMQKTPRGNAAVTVVHSAVKDIKFFTRLADILVAALGSPEFIRGDMLKPGAAVIDVGVNRVEAEVPKGYRLVGDVRFQEAVEVASYITPVPGGVGPMTIAMLLKNTLTAYKLQTEEQNSSR